MEFLDMMKSRDVIKRATVVKVSNWNCWLGGLVCIGYSCWVGLDSLLGVWFGLVCFGLGGGANWDQLDSRLVVVVCRSIAQVFHTNLRNKGLISVDRRTSLLSHVQYPVPYQSRLQRIYRSQCPSGDWVRCWAEAYRYAQTQRSVSIVAFQHGFWLRGVQSLSCRW